MSIGKTSGVGIYKSERLIFLYIPWFWSSWNWWIEKQFGQKHETESMILFINWNIVCWLLRNRMSIKWVHKYYCINIMRITYKAMEQVSTKMSWRCFSDSSSFSIPVGMAGTDRLMALSSASSGEKKENQFIKQVYFFTTFNTNKDKKIETSWAYLSV